jgi:hypothetical protein
MVITVWPETRCTPVVSNPNVKTQNASRKWAHFTQEVSDAVSSRAGAGEYLDFQQRDHTDPQHHARNVCFM